MILMVVETGATRGDPAWGRCNFSPRQAHKPEASSCEARRRWFNETTEIKCWSMWRSRGMNCSMFNSFILSKTLQLQFAEITPKIHGMFWVGAPARTVTRCGQTRHGMIPFWGVWPFRLFLFLLGGRQFAPKRTVAWKGTTKETYPRNHFLPPSPLSCV